jgi:hypothetical protein
MTSTITFDQQELAALNSKLASFDGSLSDNEKEVLRVILSGKGGEGREFHQDKSALVRLAKAVEGPCASEEGGLDWLYNIWTYHF